MSARARSSRKALPGRSLAAEAAERAFLVARLDPRRSTADHWSTGKTRATFAELDDAVSFALGRWLKEQRKRTWFVVDAGTLSPSLDRSLVSSEEASIVFRAEAPRAAVRSGH